LDAQATISRGNEAGPHRITNTMAFMFESFLMPRICPWALESPFLDPDYYQCWIGLKSHFQRDATDGANEKDINNRNGHDETKIGAHHG
jgi:homogentisate 1,2-dioxygenase